jgi:hypothetical protein
MLIRRGESPDKVRDNEMAAVFRKHLNQIQTWLGDQPNFEVLYVSYNEILKDPIEPTEKINQFLGNTLNVEKMVDVVDPNLYRQRRGQGA